MALGQDGLRADALGWGKCEAFGEDPQLGDSKAGEKPRSRLNPQDERCSL